MTDTPKRRRRRGPRTWGATLNRSWADCHQPAITFTASSKREARQLARERLSIPSINFVPRRLWVWEVNA